MTVENQTIYTSTGRKFPLYGASSDVHPDDIAHALSMQCRFTGHLCSHYSVAQHSVWGARWLQRHGFDRTTQAIFLFHDASEAYLSDLARPFKGEVKGYHEIEEMLAVRIMERFGLPGPSEWPPIIKVVDMLACFVEARDFHADGVWTEMRGLDDRICIPQYKHDAGQGFAGTYRQLVALEPKLRPWAPQEARHNFKDWYNYYRSRETVL